MKSLPIVILILTYSLVNLSAESVLPSSAPPESALTEGKTGTGFQPQAGRPLTYPLTMLDLGAGTIAFWVHINDPASEAANLPLISSGAPPATWLYLHLNDGQLRFLFQKGVKPFTGVGEFYLNTAVDVADWEPDSWHHIVVSWAENSQEGGVIIAVDGIEREARFNVSLSSGQSLPSLTLGHNSAHINAGSGRIVLDEIKVWNLPFSPSQIQEAFQGETPEADAVVLSTDFEDGLEGHSTATLSPDLSSPEALASKLSQ